jgi:hypothetical protein
MGKEEGNGTASENRTQNVAMHFNRFIFNTNCKPSARTSRNFVSSQRIYMALMLNAFTKFQALSTKM